jgi:methyl-accepting chemotaxis protein/methyl-accepting chemotaxis protein-1 (serine sensor receptor)
MTVGKKLLVSFGAMFFSVLVVCTVSVLGFSSLDRSIGKLIQVNTRKVFLASRISGGQAELMAAERGIIARYYMKDPAMMAKYDGEFKTAANRIRNQETEFAALVETVEGRRLTSELRNAAERVGRNHESVYRLATAGQIDEAVALFRDQSMPELQKMREICDNLVQRQGALNAAMASETARAAAGSRWLIMLLTLLAVLVGAGGMCLVCSLNRTLRQTVKELAVGSEQAASAASQVSSSSQTLAQGASEQAAALEQTSASSTEVHQMARSNDEHASLATRVMKDSAVKFTVTNDELGETMVAMGEISAQSGKISKIIQTIDEIAFQTNILALNAAVEAARAGEAGMGFAVVAEEVRNLSQRCAQAARDTTALIEESITKADVGRAKVDQVAASVQAVMGDAAKVAQLVEQVHLGSQQQAGRLQEISKAVSQMEQVTQQTAASAEEGASAAEELHAQSQIIRTVADRLTTMVGE